MGINSYESANSALSRLIGEQCWAVAYGPNTWTNMSLKVGTKAIRPQLLKHRTNPEPLKYFDSPYSIYVEGPWTIVAFISGAERTFEHSVKTLEVAKELFTGATITQASIAPESGATFHFSTAASLIVHQQRLLGEEPVESVLSVFFQSEYFQLDSAGQICWCERK